MTKIEFFSLVEINQFTDYLKDSWSQNLVFTSGEHRYSSIKDALTKYKWKFNIKNEPLKLVTAKEGVTFRESNDLLSELQQHIKSSLVAGDEQGLYSACRAVLKWGGVLGSEKWGNLAYLNNFREKNIKSTLLQTFAEVENYWKILNCSESPIGQLVKFRSNAGFTKIHSLLLDDFIIFDSRVAAALTYLMFKKFGLNTSEVLRICIPAGRLSKNDSKYKRNPNHSIFRTITQDSQKHFVSNVIASWIISKVVEGINNDNLENKNISLREFEAALFMIGYDVSNGL